MRDSGVLYDPGHMQKDAVGKLGQAGLPEGCRRQEDVREWSGSKPRGSPPRPCPPPGTGPAAGRGDHKAKKVLVLSAEWTQGGVEVAPGWQPCEVARGASGRLH